jgi:hypothetical protein
MKLRVVGTALIITSSLTVAEMTAAKTFDPASLTVRDEDGNDVFSARQGSPSVSEFGASFNGADAQGNLQATIVIPDQETAEAKTEYVKATYGVAIAALAANEGKIKDAINNKLATVNSAFEGFEVE